MCVRERRVVVVVVVVIGYDVMGGVMDAVVMRLWWSWRALWGDYGGDYGGYGYGGYGGH